MFRTDYILQLHSTAGWFYSSLNYIFHVLVPICGAFYSINICRYGSGIRTPTNTPKGKVCKYRQTSYIASMPPRNINGSNASLCLLYSWYANGRKIPKNTPRQKLANFNVPESILILNAEPSPSNLLTAKKDLPSQILRCTGKGGINLLRWLYSPLYWKLFIHPEGSGTEIVKDLFPIFSSWNNPL